MATAHRKITAAAGFNLKVHLRRFSDFLFAQRGLAPTTAADYQHSIERVSKTIGFFPTPLAVERYISGMHQKRYSYSHIVNTSLALERYAEFLGKPIQLGRPRKPQPILKDTLSEAEMSVILAATQNIRERAILSVLAYSGVRNKELCALKVSDVDFGEGLLNVIGGKGHKDRFVCIAGPCVKILVTYIKELKRPADGALFTTLRKEQPYRQQDLRKLVHVVAKRAKITRRVWPHLFRHSLATNMLNRGANVVTIQKLLGHSFLETTMIYLRSQFHRTKAEYALFVPSYL